MKQRALQLTRNERRWLKRYRDALAAVRPGAVERLIVYGSKARGEAGPDSDLDVLLIVTTQAATWKRKLRRIGYLLAARSDVVPSILAYTQDEWESRKKSGSAFRRAVERDGVQVP